MAYIKNIEELNNSSIVETIKAYDIVLKKNGVNYKGNCPFHDEKTASFIVSESKGLAKCFGCGASTPSPIAFAMKKTGLDYIDAVKDLADKLNFTLIEEHATPEQAKVARAKISKTNKAYKLLDGAKEFYKKNLKESQNTSKYWQELTKKRQLKAETIEDFEIGIATDDFTQMAKQLSTSSYFGLAKELGIVKSKDKGNSYDQFIDRIVFPIYNPKNGKVIGFSGQNMSKKDFAKYLNSTESFIFKKNNVLFGWNLAKNSILKEDVAILTEGNYDVVSAHDKGMSNTVASLGTSITKNQLLQIKKLSTNLLLVLDGDKAGIKSTLKTIEMATQMGFMVEVYICAEGTDLHDLAKAQKSQLKDYIYQNKTDGIIWYADYLLRTPTNIGEQQKGVAKIVELLNKIEDTFILLHYIDKLYKKVGVTKADFKKIVFKSTETPKEEKKATAESLIPTNAQDDYAKYGFYEKDGAYYSIKGKGGAMAVSNFTMQILFHIKEDNENTSRLIRLTNDFNYTVQIKLKTDEIIEASIFRKKIEDYGRFLWFGDSSDLIKLRDKLYREEKQAQYIDVMGYNKTNNLFQYANGIVDGKTNQFIPIDSSCMVSLGKNKYFYLPFLAEEYKENSAFEKHRNFTFTQSKISINEYINDIVSLYGVNGKVGVLFNFLTLFSDIIYQKYRRVPLLNAYGRPQSGKSSFVESLLYFFTNDFFKINMEAKSSATAVMRLMQQISNVPIFIEEYKNDRQKDGMLKALYDRDGKNTARYDNSIFTKNPKVQATAYVTGQDIPNSEPALLSRFVHLQFFETKRTLAQQKNKENIDSKHKQGISSLHIHILSQRKAFENKIANLLEESKNLLREKIDNTNFTDRYQFNFGLIHSIYELLKEELNLNFDTSKERFIDQLVKIIEMQLAIESGSDDISKFWQEIESLAVNKILAYGTHYYLENGLVWIRFGPVNSLYKKHLPHDNQSYIADSTLRTYLTSDTRYRGNKRKYFPNGERVWALGFDYKGLNISLMAEPEEGDGYEVRMREYEAQTGINITEIKDQKAKDEDLPF